ncbi:MAG TPA: polysaccharide deacetylase family protein [Candidatus Sulfotelmatobacter sp.]|nr:polysaccharide deacetylase family protein [Candidatus Sulfotelmatobacter sp.]
MKVVSPLLKRVVYPSFAKAGVFRRTAAQGLAVLAYHGILPRGYESTDATFDDNLLSAEAFRQQIRLLKASYRVISPEEVFHWTESKFSFPPRSVLLTCDDGLLNNLTEMLPVIEEEGVRCLFFVTGASADDGRATLWYEELLLLFLQATAGSFTISSADIEISGVFDRYEQRREVWWNSVKQLSQFQAASRKAFLDAARIRLRPDGGVSFPGSDSALERRFRLLSPGELKQLESAGMTIGAHSMSHPLLSHLPSELARAEVSESRSCLEAVLGKRVWAFAYPFGDPQSVTPEVFAMTEEAGYAAAFLNYGGGLGMELPRYGIPRIHVTASMGLSELEAHVAGFYSSWQRRTGRSPQNGLRAAQE